MAEYGFDVLLGIARFWAQRVNWSEAKQAYVMLGVTGPNEYENNVNNNWYTNYIAAWTLRYTAEVEAILRQHFPEAYAKKVSELNFDASELKHWADVSNKMHYPQLEGTEIFLQQDGFMDKEQLTVTDLDPSQRPINQHWSWDRILRSIFIKQADTLQGFYFFEDDFTESQHKANFDFYEPRTVHESSLSPCVHAVLAAKLGMEEKAYEMYLRTARLDLDDYNHEVYQGLHITSMAGTWMAVVEGFGGLRIRNGKPHFQTMLPAQWDGFTFKILFRDRLLEVKISREGTRWCVTKGSLEVGSMVRCVQCDGIRGVEIIPSASHASGARSSRGLPGPPAPATTSGPRQANARKLRTQTVASKPMSVSLCGWSVWLCESP